jgi:hypothetical protein
MQSERRESYNPLLKSYPDSEKVNAVCVGAETLFTRLLAQSDDLAHYYGELHPPNGQKRSVSNRHRTMAQRISKSGID